MPEAALPYEVWCTVQPSGGAVTAVSYTLTSGSGSSTFRPRNWTLLGSNNGSTWTQLDAQFDQTFSGTAATNTYDFTNSTPYAYYRLYVFHAGGDFSYFQTTGFELAEFHIWTGASGTGSDVTSGATVSASSDTGPSNLIATAFDNNTSTQWVPTTTNPNSGPNGWWIGYYFPAAYAINKYTITSGNDADERDAQDWYLQSSDNGVDWTNADTRTGEDFPGRNLTQTYTFTNTVGAHRWWRLFVTKLGNGGTTSGLIQINEIEMEEVAGPTPLPTAPVPGHWRRGGRKPWRLNHPPASDAPLPETTGTLAVTEGTDTAVFAGSVVVSGPLTVTEATDTAAFAGKVEWTGTLAVTESPDTAAFAGKVEWTATLAVTEGPDTAAFAGRAGWTGTLAVTEATDTALFAGRVEWTGTLAVTETQDTAAFAGRVEWTGTLAVTEGTDTAVFAGDVVTAISGTLVVTEGTDTAAFAGDVPIIVSGTLAVTEGVDTAALAGSVLVSGALAVTENADIANFAGSSGEVLAGDLFALEAADTAAFAGKVEWTTALVVTESPDAATFVGRSSWTGSLAVTEGVDTAAFAGRAGWTGTLAATEATDTAVFAGSVKINAALAVTEAKDTAFFITELYDPILVVLAATEARDSVLFGGQLGVLVALAATESADSAVFNGMVLDHLFGTLAATEAPDTALFLGPIRGYLAASELPDVVRCFGQPEPDLRNMRFGYSRVVIPRRL